MSALFRGIVKLVPTALKHPVISEVKQQCQVNPRSRLNVSLQRMARGALDLNHEGIELTYGLIPHRGILRVSSAAYTYAWPEADRSS